MKQPAHSAITPPFLYFLYLIYFLYLVCSAFFYSLPTIHYPLPNKKDRQRGALCRPNDSWLILSWLCHVRCLGAFRSLDNLELYRVSFLQGAVAIPYDCGIMNKNVWTIFAPDEAVPFRVIKPFYGSLHVSTPPDGDLDVPRGRLNREPTAANGTNCAECNRNLRSVKTAIFLRRVRKSTDIRLQKRFNRKQVFFVPELHGKNPATYSKYRICHDSFTM